MKALNTALEQRTAERNRLWRLCSEAMLVARLDGTIVTVHPAWRAMLGWEPGRLPGTSFLDLVHPEDRETTEAAVARIARGESVSDLHNRFRRSDGGWRWLNWSAVPDEACIHAIGRDITASMRRRNNWPRRRSSSVRPRRWRRWGS
jgi:PAS domain S-box-containing protein